MQKLGLVQGLLGLEARLGSGKGKEEGIRRTLAWREER